MLRAVRTCVAKKVQVIVVTRALSMRAECEEEEKCRDASIEWKSEKSEDEKKKKNTKHYREEVSNWINIGSLFELCGIHRINFSRFCFSFFNRIEKHDSAICACSFADIFSLRTSSFFWQWWLNPTAHTICVFIFFFSTSLVDWLIKFY